LPVAFWQPQSAVAGGLQPAFCEVEQHSRCAAAEQ
jgi:hypothetical protein